MMKQILETIQVLAQQKPMTEDEAMLYNELCRRATLHSKLMSGMLQGMVADGTQCNTGERTPQN
jgi:hypothetical protein